MGFARIPRLRGILANPTTLKLGCNRPLVPAVRGRRYLEIRESCVLPMASVSAQSAPVLGRFHRRVFSDAGAGGTSSDVTNSETQFAIIKPPFVRPAALFTNLGLRGNSCYSLTAYPRLQSATAPQFRSTTRK